MEDDGREMVDVPECLSREKLADLIPDNPFAIVQLIGIGDRAQDHGDESNGIPRQERTE